MRMKISRFGARPLLLFTPGFLLGLTASGPVLPGLGLLAACAILARSAPPARILLVLLAGFVAGQARDRLSPRIRDLPPAMNASATGTVAGPSRHYQSRGRESVYFELRLERLDGRREYGRLRVRRYGKLDPLLGGERIAVQGRLLSLRAPLNPGQFDRAGWLRRRGIRAVFQAERVDLLSKPGPLPKLRSTLKKRMERACRAEVAALASALLLGERTGLDPSLVRDLRRSGAAHFLAVSGLHVSIIATTLWCMLSLLRIPRRRKMACLLGLLWCYALLAGLPASVVRATTMATFWLGADLLGRKRDALTSLSATALLLLLLDPGQRSDAGFQLSFLAVLGILLFSPLFQRLLAPGKGALAKIAGLLVVSIAAWTTTSPIVQTHFQLLTPSAPVASLLLFPFILAIMAGGTGSLLLPEAGRLTAFSYECLEKISAVMTSLPATHFFRAAPSPAALAFYYTGLALWAIWMRRHPRLWKVTLLLPLLLPLGFPAPTRPAPSGPRICVLAMGRGLCVYGEFPDGRNFLFDAGSLDHPDPGRTLVAPFLWARGITRIDTLFLSHPDADHVNGTVSLLERFPVGHVIASPSFRNTRLPALVRERGIPFHFRERASRPERLARGLLLLGPPDWDRFGSGFPTNETSLVLLVSHGERRILLTGDIEERGTSRLVKEMKDLRADILVVPHHGKSNERIGDLIRAVDPLIAIVPGPRRYASPKTLGLLDDKCLLMVTGSTGAIEIEPREDRWLIRTFRPYFRAAR